MADVIDDLASYLGILPAPHVQPIFHEFVEPPRLLRSYWGNRRGSNPKHLLLRRQGRSPTPLVLALLGTLFPGLLLGLPTILFRGHCWMWENTEARWQALLLTFC